MNPAKRMIVAIRHRQPAPVFSSETILERLERNNQALHQLTSTTEGEFIRVGEHLQDFYFRTRKLADLSRQVAGQLTGESWLQWIAELNTIFGRIRQQDGAGMRGTETLGALLKRFDDIRTRQANFDSIVRNLHVLCNYIKIESARLGKQDSGFFALGEDVRMLADSITEKSGNLDRQSRQLMESIRDGMGRIAAIESQQAGQSRSILAQADRNLEAMVDHKRDSSQTLEETAASWARISHSIGEMVASMQFHDISRQRIEHVRDALSDARKIFDFGSDLSKTRIESAGNMHKVAWIEHLLTLVRKNGHSLRKTTLPPSESLNAACLTFDVQIVQLNDTRTEITGAVERIIHHLRQVATELSVMSDKTRSLISAESSQSNSFLSELETHLAQLADAISGYGSIHRQSAESLVQITASVREMSGFIRQIEGIGIQMKRIALNAAIRAAHIGQEGAALGVLADAIRQLADDTSAHLEILAADLKALIDQAGHFTDDRAVARSDPAVEKIDDLPAAIHKMMGSLKAMDETVSGLLGKIDQDGSSLMQEIETTVSGIHVHERMGQVLQQVSEDLKALVQEVRTACPISQSISQIQTDKMDDGSDRYTMEREREIHRSVSAAAAGGSGGSATVAATVAAGVISSIEQVLAPNPGADQASGPVQAADEMDISDILFDMDEPGEDGSSIVFSASDPSAEQAQKDMPDEISSDGSKKHITSEDRVVADNADDGSLGDNVELF